MKLTLLGTERLTDKRPKRQPAGKGGKRRKKTKDVLKEGGGGAVTLCQIMNICDSSFLG